MTKSRNINRPKWRPTEAELELVRRNFATSKTMDLAQALGVAYHQVARLARMLGLQKDEAWLNGPAGGRLDGQRGAGNRFQPGHESWIKGKKLGPGWSKATQFKPGHQPHNHAPVGSLRHISVQGYLQIKVQHTGYPPRDWVMYHRWLWERERGPVPAGHIVAFKDGIKRTTIEDITIDVLELRTRREHMEKNSFHRYGAEVVRAVQLRSALSRAINRRERKSEQQ
jgi:hypothetical protein